MSEWKQEHAGFVVEENESEGFPFAVRCSGIDIRWYLVLGKCDVLLPSLESAAALRDALSAFLAFHKPG